MGDVMAIRKAVSMVNVVGVVCAVCIGLFAGGMCSRVLGECVAGCFEADCWSYAGQGCLGFNDVVCRGDNDGGLSQYERGGRCRVPDEPPLPTTLSFSCTCSVDCFVFSHSTGSCSECVEGAYTTITVCKTDT